MRLDRNGWLFLGLLGACAGEGCAARDDAHGAAPGREGAAARDANSPATLIDGAAGGPDGKDGNGGATGHAGAPADARAPREADASNFDAAPTLDSGAARLADGGAPPLVCHGPGARFVTDVVAHQFGPGQSDGQAAFPTPILGPPKGGGLCQGSTDTVSLGNGGWVVVEFRGNAIVDGPGPDFIVFENPFEVGCAPGSVFAELGTVAVSEDGVTWSEFPCTATKPPYGQCSGWNPVLANADTNTIDPTDPAVAGGDPYDLADLGVSVARYVRITDRPDLTGISGVYDLDAVAIVHPECE